MHRLNTLIDLACLLGQQSDYQEVLRIVTHQSAMLSGSETSLIMMINPQTHETVKTVFSIGEDKLIRQYRFLHTNISGWVIKNNESLLSRNIKKDDRFRKNLFKNVPIKSVMCVPLRTEGIIIGTILLVERLDKKVFSDEDLSFLEKFAAISAPFLRNIQKIQQYFTAPIPKEALLTKYQNLGLLGKSSRFIELIQAIEAAARCDVRVLMEGESGTGKELVAKLIHQMSSRSSNKFVAIDCGAIPGNLIESELFGHVKGAFTGATSPRKGLMEEADHGTLFLDEITNLPFDLQAKLLRVLQEGEIRPVGSNQIRKVNVRFISASSSPLRTMVQNKKFREDLYFRLHVYPINVPSLNKRRDDIPLLANFFLKKYAGQQQKNIESFHEEILDFLRNRLWEGNIRELENFIERLVTLAPPGIKIIDHETLPPEFKTELKRTKKWLNTTTLKKSLNDRLTEYEKQIVRQSLTDNEWNQSRAARDLKISEQSIRYKMKRLGIQKPR